MRAPLGIFAFTNLFREESGWQSASESMSAGAYVGFLFPCYSSPMNQPNIPRAVQASIARTLIVTWTSGVEHTFDLGTSAACSASTTSAVDGYVRLGSNKGGNHGRGTTAVFAIELQAVSPQAQHRRAYEIHVDQDLFSQLVVAIDFGVIGARGQRRVNAIKIKFCLEDL
jgi:hypothetical protein